MDDAEIKFHLRELRTENIRLSAYIGALHEAVGPEKMRQVHDRAQELIKRSLDKVAKVNPQAAELMRQVLVREELPNWGG